VKVGIMFLPGDLGILGILGSPYVMALAYLQKCIESRWEQEIEVGLS